MLKQKKWLVVFISFFIISICSSYTIVTISNEMIGISRVINYAGIVRGATQRLVKLEISNNQNDQLITHISDILNQLQSDELSNYNLKKIDDIDYQNSLAVLESIWQELILEIEQTRLLGYENTNIIEISEIHFENADNSVTLAEQFSDRTLDLYNFTKYILIITYTFLIISLLFIFQKLMFSKKEIKRIENVSHIDLQTGLPNRSKFYQKIESYGILNKNINYALIMFDLNNLKQTNDTFGHAVGDQLIQNFSNILKNISNEECFIARIGGDEFIVIYDNITNNKIQLFIDEIRISTEKFNLLKEDINISYAVGYALSDFKEDITLTSLLEMADINMYADKKKCKECTQK